MNKLHAYILTALLLTPLAAINAADVSPAPVTPATTPAVSAINKNQETDKRMPANTAGGWKLEKAKVTNPSLPRVLLIGDSILGGYRSLVIKALAGKANVDTWLTPIHQGRPDTLSQYKEAISQDSYQVIHFNIGLHGIQPGRIPADKYIPLTRALVQAIRDTAPQAKVIWANTTPALRISETDELDPEMNPVVVAHNAMAAQIMAEYKIPTNDLYSLMVAHLDLRKGGKDNFHWKPEANPLMAKIIVESIERELAALKK